MEVGMNKDVTIFGFFRRQITAFLAPFIFVGVAVFVYLFFFSSIANARDRDPNQQTQNFNQDTLNQTIPYPPAFQLQAGAVDSSRGEAGNKRQIWAAPVSYTRTTNFVNRYVQADMRLGVTFKYNFSFTLLSRDSNKQWQPPPDGWYQVTLAVVAAENNSKYYKKLADKQNPIKPSVYDRYVTSNQFYEYVSGGRLLREIELKFDNITATTLMSHLYIEFVPLQKNCVDPRTRQTRKCIAELPNGQSDPKNSLLDPLPILPNYTPYFIDMPFVPYVSAGRSETDPVNSTVKIHAQQLRKTSESLRDYVVKAKTLQEKTLNVRTTTPEEYAANGKNKLTYMKLNDPRILGFDSRWFPQALGRLMETASFEGLTLDQSRTVLSGLCSVLATSNPQFKKAIHGAGFNKTSAQDLGYQVQRCTQNPLDYLEVTSVMHVYAFDGDRASVISETPDQLTVQSSFWLTRSKSEDSTLTWNPTQMAFKGLEAFGLNLTGFTYSVSYSDTTAEAESAGGSRSLRLDFPLVEMNIPVFRSQRCLQVRGLPNSNSPFFDDRSDSQFKGIYICGEKIRKDLDVSETYAHAVVHSGEMAIIDSYSTMAQFLNVALRGEANINAFNYFVRKNTLPLYGTRTRKMVETAQKKLGDVPTAEFGLIAYPIGFPAMDSRHNFIQRLVGDYFERF